MTARPDPRLQEVRRLKAILDAKWQAKEAVLVDSLDQGMITWRRRKDGDWEVKLKPDI